jgi:hypothetical protein
LERQPRAVEDRDEPRAGAPGRAFPRRAMITITNISPHRHKHADHEYILKIGREEIARFTHTRSKGLGECLREAANAADRARGLKVDEMVRKFFADYGSSE